MDDVIDVALTTSTTQTQMMDNLFDQFEHRKNPENAA